MSNGKTPWWIDKENGYLRDYEGSIIFLLPAKEMADFAVANRIVTAVNLFDDLISVTRDVVDHNGIVGTFTVSLAHDLLAKLEK